MSFQVNKSCDQHSDRWDCGDSVVVYLPYFDEYGLPLRDGGTSMILVQHCPFCGTELPQSKRDAWMDAMEQLGIDVWEGEIPEPYQSDNWWKNTP